MGTELKQFNAGRLFTEHCIDGTVQNLVDSGSDLLGLMRRYDLSRSTIVRKMRENNLQAPKGFYSSARVISPDRVIHSDARKLAMSARW